MTTILNQAPDHISLEMAHHATVDDEIEDIAIASDTSSHYESDPDDYEMCDCVDQEENRVKIIPYTALYEEKDEALERGFFLPGHPVKATITDVERDTSDGHHLFNPFLYTIELEHAEYKWTVKKRYKDFQHLNNRLLLFRATEKIKTPYRILNQSLFYSEADPPANKAGRCVEQPRVHELGDAKPISTTQSVKYQKRDSEDREDNANVTYSELERKAIAQNAHDISHAKRSIKFEPTQRELTRHDKDEHGHSQKSMKSHKCDSTDGVCQHELADGTVGHTRHKACKLPDFPHWPESMISDRLLTQRKVILEEYLQGVLHIPAYRRHQETADFLDVSRLSFIHNLGGKYNEGLLKKRPGGRKANQGCSGWCIEFCAPWSRRYLVLKDSHITYLDKKGDRIRCVLLFDREFQVISNSVKAGKHGLLISNLSRDLQLLASTVPQHNVWVKAIEANVKSAQGSIWTKSHAFGSTFPNRMSAYAQWFVDGKHYMRHAANMIELAQEEILIADWWLSPQIYLKRPMTEGNRWRLDQLLKRKAEQGIKIFVLLYKEVEMALGISSVYSKRILQELHSNIKVIRHPDHVIGGANTILLWAHHEKLLIIDQNIAFVGGIDLCYGRYDDCMHYLTDTGSVQYDPTLHVNDKVAGKTITGGLKQAFKASMAIEGALPDDENIGQKEGIDEPDKDGKLRPSTGTRGSTPSMQDVAIKAGVQAGGAIAKGDTSDEEGEKKIKDIRMFSGVKSKKKVHGGWGAVLKSTLTPRKNMTAEMQTASECDPSSSNYTQSSARNQISENDGLQKDDKCIERSNTPSSGNATFPTQKLIPKDETRKQSKFRSIASKVKRSKSHGDAMTRTSRTPTGGVDFADLVNKYKRAVDQGAVEDEKKRAETPPPEKRRTKIARKALNAFKSGTKRNRWRIKEHDEGLFGEGYDIHWLEVMNSQPDETDFDGGTKLWIGKDYVNFIFKDFTDLEEPFHDFIDRGTTCRMPWHDIHSVVYGAAARDVARHFIQRWNAAKLEKLKHEDNYPYLLPKSYHNTQVPRIFKNISMKCNVQVLRSACTWSHGAKDEEDSIQQAYLHMIANAQHYVYIENQFYVSLINHPDVKNEICKTIADRVVRAHQNNENFRIFVNIPLLPGFEGQLGATGGSALQAVMHWTFQSINQGPNCLFAQLAERGIEDPDKYISFTSLRTWDILNGRLVTELVYIHSKLIIADDTMTLIGSANINDRSQMGRRDSEVALFFRDTDFIDSRMNGKPYKAGRFARTLRIHLMKEHLGLLDKQQEPRNRDREPIKSPAIDCSDPVCDDFWQNVWWKTSIKNTNTFEKVFRCIPSDSVRKLEDIAAFQNVMNLCDYDPNKARDTLRQETQGNLVIFPLKFLKDSSLQPSVTTKEGLAPVALFT